jgi:hypothetical protein
MFVTPAQAGGREEATRICPLIPAFGAVVHQLDLNLDELRYWLIKQTLI